MAISSALDTLRGVPTQQASIYNTYLTKSAKVRMDAFLPGDARLKQIGALVATAQQGLQALQETMNSSIESVKKAALPPTDIPTSDFYDGVIRDSFTHGSTLVGVCEQLVADNSLPGFASLKRLLPWLGRAGQLPGCTPGCSGDTLTKACKSAGEIVAPFELKLLPAKSQAAAQELQEVNACMGFARDNFEKLQEFFKGQLLPGAVAGTFTRMGRLYNWVPFMSGRPDATASAFILLTTDLPELSPRNYFAPVAR